MLGRFVNKTKVHDLCRLGKQQVEETTHYLTKNYPYLTHLK